MADEIDISDRSSPLGPHGADPEHVLRLIMAQVVADASSAVSFLNSREGAQLRYEVTGSWYEMIPPPPAVMAPLLRILRERAGIAPDASWGSGRVRFRTEKGPMIFRVDACSDGEGRSIALVSREIHPSEGGPMFERFTDRARKALALADQEAQRLNHKDIGTEHLLLGLMRENSGVAATVLKGLGLDLQDLRREVEILVPSGPDRITMGNLPRTARAEKALEYAAAEVRALNNNYIGTEHLLLGLLHAPEATAPRVLASLGAKPDVVRAKVLALLGRSVADEGFSQEIGTMQMLPRETITVEGASGRGPGVQRFTDRARKVMALANQEAQRLNHAYLGTGHLLLGLMKEGSGVGATALQNLGVDIQKLCAEVEKLLKSGPDVVLMGKLPMTPRARMAVEYAIEESVTLNHHHVGTEHLVLGLLREPEGIAAQVLGNLGLTLESVRSEVLSLVGIGTPGGAAGSHASGSVCSGTGEQRQEATGYKDLSAWQKADELAQQVYALTGESEREGFPDALSRLRAKALSLPPYIAEAHSREIPSEARWLLNGALVFLRELRYLVDFARRLKYVKDEDGQRLESLANEVHGLLRLLYRNVSERSGQLRQIPGRREGRGDRYEQP